MNKNGEMRKCLNCPTEFYAYGKSVKKYCSRPCQGQWISKMGLRSGSNNGHWKGGISPDQMGYLKVTHGKLANRHFHRLMVENCVNRELTANEVVHHINGDKMDNRIENLDLMTRAEHLNHHRADIKSKKVEYFE